LPVGSLISTRTGRRIIAVVVIAVLVIAAFSIYVGERQLKSSPSSSLTPGSAVLNGIPPSVNLTSVHSWAFTLSISVKKFYVSGIVLSITSNSTASNATAYFTVAGSNWKLTDSNSSVHMAASFFPAGMVDSNISLVVSGSGNVSGWIGISTGAVVGTIIPSFVRMNVFTYHPPAKVKTVPGSIVFTNLPNEITVLSGSQGTFMVHYIQHNVSGPMYWKENVTWFPIYSVNSTSAIGSYSAPFVSVNTTYNVSVSVTSGSGASASSYLLFHVLVNRTVAVVSYIRFNNLPATITVQSGSSGRYVINYTAVNVTHINWTDNVSWLSVSTFNSTEAFANYTAPNVASNTTFVVDIEAYSGNVSNSSTLTFTVTVPSPSVQRYIRFNNLPATITVQSGSSGRYVINYTASGLTGEIYWNTSAGWVSVSGISPGNADANYTAPFVMPVFNFSTHTFSNYSKIFVVDIEAYSGNVSNSSTLTFIVVAPHPAFPSGNVTVVDNIYLNDSLFDANINGGLHISLFQPPPSPHPLTFVIYNYIYMNHSTMLLNINGGIHFSIPSGPSIHIVVYNVLFINNSVLEVNINGGIQVSPPAPLSPLPLSIYTTAYIRNSTVMFSINGNTPASQPGRQNIQPATPGGSDDSATLLLNSLFLNHSTALVDINGGYHLDYNGLPAAQMPQGLVNTLLDENYSYALISINGGVHISFSVLPPQPQPAPPSPLQNAAADVQFLIEMNSSTLNMNINGGLHISLFQPPPPPPPTSQQQISFVLKLNGTTLNIDINGGLYLQSPTPPTPDGNGVPSAYSSPVAASSMMKMTLHSASPDMHTISGSTSMQLPQPADGHAASLPPLNTGPPDTPCT
jgi:hypothetical protein